MVNGRQEGVSGATRAYGGRPAGRRVEWAAWMKEEEVAKKKSPKNWSPGVEARKCGFGI
jgi:hypothetical protein